MKMKKTVRYLILISAALIAALLNVILFLTVPDGRTDTAVFWLSWSFAFPFNIIVFLLIHFWTGRRDANALVQMPVAYYISFVFTAVYLVIGAIFMYLPVKGLVFPIILLLTVTVVYAIISMYAVFSVEYITKNERYTKSKVMFIALLKADIDDITANTSDGALISRLTSLSDAVRFSDPMSHPSLAGVEGQISSKVMTLGNLAREGDTASALKEIEDIERLLDSRNNRCKILK